MIIAYITAQTPYGKGEQFILPEIIELIGNNNEVVIIPIRPDKKLGDGFEPKQVSPYTISVPLFNLYVLLKSIIIFFKYPIKTLKIIGKIVLYSGSIIKIIKNLIVLPKGLVTGYLVKKKKVEHIHAHWASTPATVAYIAACISDIPWSFTCHRWDITENNMITEKVRNCKFVRTINKRGFNEIINIVGDEYKSKCHVIHVGINIKTSNLCKKINYNRDKFIIVTPANLIEVKGHKYLIEAIKKLIKENYNVTCMFYGDGILKEQLEEVVRKEKLQNKIFIEGQISHDELMKLYEDKRVDCVILPSITTENGEKEGIPVSLMEAMSYKIPVISTNTGGIPELLANDAGIIVEQKSSEQLKDAIKLLINNQSLNKRRTDIGFNKVYSEFNSHKVVNKLTSLF
jgi:colanic acid/amylovoran biosynthesis glycosyltransferase